MQRDPYLGKIRPSARLNGNRRPGRVGRLLVPILVAGGVIGALAGMYYLIASKQLLAVEQVVVRGVERLSPGGVRSVAGILPGENILRVDLDAPRQRLETQAWVASAAVSRQFPSTILIKVWERKPFALVELGQTYIVDCYGVLLQSCESCNALPFPRVTGLGDVENCSLGTVLPGLANLLDIVSLAQTSDFFSRYGLAALDSSDPRHIRLFTQRGDVEVRLGAGLTRTQLEDLDEVLPRLPETRRIAYISVSGNRRVVVKVM